MPHHESHPDVAYEDEPPAYRPADKPLGVLRFSKRAGLTLVHYAKVVGVSPDIGCWTVNAAGDRYWDVSLPAPARLLFDGLAHIMDNGITEGVPLPPEARERVLEISTQMRDGVSLASDHHPDVPELADLKRDMTLALARQRGSY